MPEITPEIHPESALTRIKHVSRSNALVADAGVRLIERSFAGQINLRGDYENPEFLRTTAEVLGIELPPDPNTLSKNAGVTVLWLGPDEWLIITPAQRQGSLMQDLRQALGDSLFALTDVSHAHTVIGIDGINAAQTLAKGCSLDMHPAVFGSRQCAQTLLAKASVVIWPNTENGFEILVRRSFAEYLWHWLEDASGEYGLAIL
jgi:sarcosine oxidase subunit gamma